MSRNKEDGVYFIAEIGKNYIDTEAQQPVATYLEKACALVDAAVESGADAVKFQTHVVEDEVLNIDFTSPHFTGSDRYSWVSRNESSTPLADFWLPLKQHCDAKDITFFSTPMSRLAAQKLEQLDVAMWKVGSGDVQDYVLLDYLIATKKPIIISTGMVSLTELEEVVNRIYQQKVPLAILYCVSQYPCPLELFNLGTVEYLQEKYPSVQIGFSDHSTTHDATLAAVQLGAKVVEKHFSFSRDLWGSDHKASLTPIEFKEMVRLVKEKAYLDVDASEFYGSKDKELEGANNKFRPFFNKGLVAGRDLVAGETITAADVFAMRPIKHIDGFSANKIDGVVGKKVSVTVKKYQPINSDVLS